ncbi:MAG: c-type cytochrome [Verrucomicrobia bacterium]|nr:c-type cytochrome [Verrucomicrobiota bacterium]
MNKMTKAIILTVALGGAMAVATQAADAKENWEKNCAKCHGPDGKGDTKMGKKLEIKDYSDPKVQDGIKDEEMAKTIKEGKKEGEKTRMKAYGEVFNDEQIKALVAYVRSLKK